MREDNMGKRQDYIDILKNTLSCIQTLNQKDVCDAEYEEKTEDVKKRLEVIKKDNRMEDLGKFLCHVLGDTSQELQELLVFLFYISKDQWFTAWQADMLLRRLKEDDNFYLCLQLRKQQDAVNFILNRKENSADEWDMNQYFQTGIQKILGMNYEKIPVENRNQKFIVIATTQLLSAAHAPTRMVLEFCRILEKYLKFKVLILYVMESVQKDKLDQLGLVSIWEANHLNYKGFCNLKYGECIFDLYQIALEDTTCAEQQELMNYIYEKKPLFVWQFAGIPSYASAMQQFTSYYYMQMTQGIPAVPADLVINYFPDSKKYDAEAFQMLQDHGVPVADMFFVFTRHASEGLLSRSQFQIPEDGYCLGIAGNRLSQECTDEFIHILAKVMEQEKTIQVLFIGSVDQEFKDRVIKLIHAEDRCFFLGFRNDLQEVLALIDLYVDLPHQGGGYSGVSALLEGKPVLCLKGGDVSAKAGDTFSYDSLQEYENEIIRYKNDSQYYRTKSNAAREIADHIMVNDAQLAEMIHKTIKSVLI